MTVGKAEDPVVHPADTGTELVDAVAKWSRRRTTESMALIGETLDKVTTTCGGIGQCIV